MVHCLLDLLEADLSYRMACDEYQVIARWNQITVPPHGFPQAPFGPISGDGVTDSLPHRETKAHLIALVARRSQYQKRSGPGSTLATDARKVVWLGQPIPSVHE